MSKQHEPSPPLAVALTQLAQDLIADYRDLREGRIGVREARARALIAREALRAVHLNFEGLRLLSERAKPVNGKARLT
ncbi:hypothetical protein [Reyranella sp.]|uniref:hypothetical protein n=1 Tax=Reyranella sp. TaxID=1929291 RepID=UPI003D15137C